MGGLQEVGLGEKRAGRARGTCGLKECFDPIAACHAIKLRQAGASHDISFLSNVQHIGCGGSTHAHICTSNRAAGGELEGLAPDPLCTPDPLLDGWQGHDSAGLGGQTFASGHEPGQQGARHSSQHHCVGQRGRRQGRQVKYKVGYKVRRQLPQARVQRAASWHPGGGSSLGWVKRRPPSPTNGDTLNQHAPRATQQHVQAATCLPRPSPPRTPPVMKMTAALLATVMTWLSTGSAFPSRPKF